MATAPKLPAWLEKLVVQALKSYVPPEVVAAAIEQWKAAFCDKIVALAAATDNQIDDRIAASVVAALTTCTPDVAFLCELIEQGEVAAVGLLRSMASASDTKIDDALVDIVAAALGVHAVARA